MSEKKRTLQKQRVEVTLDAGGIDRLSALLTDALTQAQADRKDIIRLRLAVEDILALWLAGLEKDTVCSFRCGTRLGRMYVEILAPGKRLDPAETEHDESGLLLCSGLLAQAGLSLVYSYQDGANRLAVYPPKKRRMSTLLQLALAIGGAAVFGLLCLNLPQDSRAVVSGAVDPLFSALMGILQTLAGPMVFLSICCGIVSIGDVQVLGRIGRTIIIRFLAFTFLLTTITALCAVWLFHPAGGSSAEGGGDAAAQIYGMILGIIPGDIVSPFLDSNSLQIIFLAVCVGLTLLVLGEKVSLLSRFVEQLNSAFQTMMEVVSRYIPLFIFVCLLSTILTNSQGNLSGVIKGVALGIAACILWPFLYAVAVSLRVKIPLPFLLRKLMPLFLLSIATASSAAVLSANLETCEKKLGISGRITSFAVPLGQVVFMPGVSMCFMLMAMGLAELYGVAISPSWMVTGILVSGMLAVAAPPIPGGCVACYTVLLAQLGIPAEAIGLAVAGNVVLDFFMTGCGITCLQTELMLSANQLGMLDREILEQP